MTLLDERPSLHMARTAFPLLTRVGGLPADVLDLVSPETRATLAEFTMRNQEAIAAGDTLVDGLFEVVPILDDDVALRRRVLAGKRAVHKARALPWTDEEIARISGLLAPAAREALETYRTASARRDRLEATVADLATSDREGALGRLHEAVRRPDFLGALVMAAPDWVRHAKPHERRATSIKDLKTLLSYVSRAAAKTSPFSGLTTVGVAGTRGEGRASSRTSAEVAVRALELLARDRDTADLLSYRAPVLRAGGPDEPSGLFLASELVSADGIVWREDRVMEADTVHTWNQRFEGLRSTGFNDLLTRLGGPDPFARFRRLLDSGVIRPVPPWRRDQDPIDVLAGLVVERASGMSYEDYVQQEIFAPLGMTHSSASTLPIGNDVLSDGHRFWFGVPFATDPIQRHAAVAAGYLISTAADLGRYLSLYLADGVGPDGKRIVSAEGIRNLLDPGPDAQLGPWAQRPLGEASGYAMGWFVDGPWGTDAIFHPGNTPDTTTMLTLFRDRV